ncbi:uncharacterized protein BT62DRAFT_938436 [Guyanagaster necrorhizus]|uniref:Magnesium transporter n=1 Tax=Guyanagaster necrorhizus TaxID=856835 RepID=A0A9P7VGA0_9AGAR|nr:uncharacterized protein BT62DRAFT_938436 [Guyanagaster necrorhizus MCA 3950]KAG7440005.1 hypothetical protein BT62DRAFT_938436 [Guyanagaster necrorhizus MCA 3950]
MDEDSPPIPVSDPVPAHHASPVVAFIIGLAIVLLASVLNAAGLNLTKLDHVRTQAIPKASRRQDWLRPLWLLGMFLYILSQLIGSTLALEYMRAEYVAPLGSTSLVFNFLFARFLVGTPVTSTDIYGTIVVVIGVIGIVAFGSINSGLATETDVEHLTQLWRRGGWLGFFFLMSFALIFLLYFTSKLDDLLGTRGDIVGDSNNTITHGGQGSGFVSAARSVWAFLQRRVTDWLELWTAPKDDKTIAWTLGIGWACCGGGLAGGTLVFAKATVKLLSGSLSHQNPGNQFGHVAPIFTIVLLVITAVLQIVCLNRGLKVYDSTLVVPVFYGVYTATGFLDSLIFNNEVDSYQSWTLFLIVVSILILISGVVLLTHKKPEPGSKASVPPSAPVTSSSPRGRKWKRANASKADLAGDADDHLQNDDEEQVLWTVGDVSDAEEMEDEDIDHHQHPLNLQRNTSDAPRIVKADIPGEEGVRLMKDSEDTDRDSDEEGDADTQRHLVDTPPQNSHNEDPFKDESEEFGAWTSVGNTR